MGRNKKVVGILGHGEIGSAVARICREAGFRALVRELAYDELKGKKVDYLHVNIPEKSQKQFVRIVARNIKGLEPKLTVINSSTTPGTTRKIHKATGAMIVHSPVMGLHPHLYDSIKNYFPKIVGPVNKKSLEEAKRHFKDLGLRVEAYDSPEDSEAAKLIDLVYYSWNIVFCKWADTICRELGLNFNQVYTRQNEIYNEGYKKLFPNAVRPILIPVPGPIGGHCAIPDTVLFHNFHKSDLTDLILRKNKQFEREVKDAQKEREKFLKLRDSIIKKSKK